MSASEPLHRINTSARSESANTRKPANKNEPLFWNNTAIMSEPFYKIKTLHKSDKYE